MLAACTITYPRSAQSADSVSLSGIEALRGFSPSTQSSSNIMFTGKTAVLEFESDSRRIFFNKTLIWLNQSATGSNKNFAISKFDADNLITPLLLFDRKETMTNRTLTIMLDPGHGGKDTGAMGPQKLYESRVTLDIARRTKKLLEGRKIKVRLTRKGDSTLTRAERSQLARKYKASLFISIHVNFAENRNAGGMETYIVAGQGFPSTAGNGQDSKSTAGNTFDTSNIQLAYCVHRMALDHTGATDRGIRHARFDVLADAPCPAILFECGFASNPVDEINLLKKEYRQTVAEGITRGIKTFLDPPSLAVKPAINKPTGTNTVSISDCCPGTSPCKTAAHR